MCFSQFFWFYVLGGQPPAKGVSGGLVRPFWPEAGGRVPPSSVDGAHEACNSHKCQGAADIIGQRCQTELAPNILNTAREKVPLPHPLLNRAKRVFDALAALIHDFKACREAFRHPIQNGLIRVSRNLSEGSICASHPQIAGLARFPIYIGHGVIVADLTVVFWFQLLAARTDQVVCIGIIVELLFCKEPGS